MRRPRLSLVTNLEHIVYREIFVFKFFGVFSPLRSVFMYFGLWCREINSGGQLRLPTCSQILGFFVSNPVIPSDVASHGIPRSCYGPAMALSDACQPWLPDPVTGQPWPPVMLPAMASQLLLEASHGHPRFTVYPGIVTPLQLATSRGNSTRAPLWVITRSAGLLLSTH